MTATDHTTGTEDDAGRADRMAAYDYRDVDHDEPIEPVDTGHDCTAVPFPDTCLSCLVWERHFIKERAAINDANNKEWFA